MEGLLGYFIGGRLKGMATWTVIVNNPQYGKPNFVPVSGGGEWLVVASTVVAHTCSLLLLLFVCNLSLSVVCCLLSVVCVLLLSTFIFSCCIALNNSVTKEK